MQVASALCASYIGGSVNFAAVSQSLGLTPGPLLAASMAADNIAMAAYLTAIMIIPATATMEKASATATEPASVDVENSTVSVQEADHEGAVRIVTCSSHSLCCLKQSWSLQPKLA